MVLDGRQSDVQPSCDLLVGQSRFDQAQNLDFARGEVLGQFGTWAACR